MGNSRKNTDNANAYNKLDKSKTVYVFHCEDIVAEIFFGSNKVIHLPNYRHNLYNRAYAGAISICGRN